jgi:hypothetical protein
VTLTDVKEVLPLLRRNYEQNLSPAAIRGGGAFEAGGNHTAGLLGMTTPAVPTQQFTAAAVHIQQGPYSMTMPCCFLACCQRLWPACAALVLPPPPSCSFWR